MGKETGSTWKGIAIAAACLIGFMLLTALPVGYFFVPYIETLGEWQQGIVALVFFPIYTVIMVAFMQLVTPYIFYYPAVGTLRTQQEVCAELQSVAAWIPGVEVKMSDRRIDFRYTYVDVAFDSGMAHHKAKYLFVVVIRFHKEKPECTLTDVMINKYNIAPNWWGFGVWTWSYFRGVAVTFQYDKALSFDRLQQRVVKQNVHWDTEELQQAIIKTLTKNGWTVRASIF